MAKYSIYEWGKRFKSLLFDFYNQKGKDEHLKRTMRIGQVTLGLDPLQRKTYKYSWPSISAEQKY